MAKHSMVGGFFAKYRLIISRIAGVFLALFVIFSQPIIQQGERYDFLYNSMLVVGLCLVLICILGRTFASLFMSDKRGQAIVSEGIYSITRNPLYFFSFLGILGIGLIYSSLIILALLIVFFSFYYYNVISNEEAFLSKKFGQEYTDYLNSGVPRFFPKMKLWESQDYVEASYKVVLKTIVDASSFFFIAIIVIVMLNLQEMGVIPTFLRIW
ncbi:MAG: isoprenylcysteine carboxylmethyltransferase family protein [Alphaproteobacteria bacterium]|jgi:protein-S-isoprenylcysteine O-methyltransferase Ste14|nr:isoprenylcysteine carboxylmethyltransferase family protein [Alphaproteobacteria bacterium]